MKRVITLLLLLVLLPVFMFAGGSNESTETKGEMSVGVFVADSFGDRAFYDIALGGIELIKEKYNIECVKYEGRLQPDNFEPLLSAAAKQNQLNFVLGFEGIDAMLKVAGKYPDSLFVFLDAVLDSPDVASMGYKDHEGTFLAGAFGALITADTGVKYINDQKIIGYIGGMDAPVMQRALWGYEQGANYIGNGTKVDNIFVGSWVDPAKGKEANMALLEKGSDINFQYAGLTGEGGFNAAREGAPFWVIGGGFDQRWLAPDNTIASVVKAVDVSIVFLTGKFLDGELKKGDSFNWGVKEKGMYLTMSEDLVPEKYINQIHDIEEKIQSGEIIVSEFRE